MNASLRAAARVAPWIVLALLGARAAAADGTALPASARVLFETGFEPFEGYDPDLDLAGQSGWVALGSGGNGVLRGPVAGFEGQVAYVGFAPPKPKEDLLNLFRPVALVPVSGDLPLVTFTVAFAIYDSTTAAPSFDDFRWSAYNTREERLFTLDFDNSTLGINVALDDGKGFASTGYQFRPNEAHDLRITLNFARNLWTADINGAVVVNAAPITTKGAKLDLNEIDAVWAVRDPAKPGNNFMVFDDYKLVALPLREIPATVAWVGRGRDGAALLRVLGEPGVNYALESSEDLLVWAPVGTAVAQSPGGAADFRDPGAPSVPSRFYRARGVQP